MLFTNIIQICQQIYSSHQHLQQFQDFHNNLPFSGINSLFLPHQFLLNKSMYWGSGVFNAVWSKPSFRKNATFYFTPAPLWRTSYTSGLLVCFLLSTLNKFLKKNCLLTFLTPSTPPFGLFIDWTIRFKCFYKIPYCIKQFKLSLFTIVFLLL